MLIKQIAGSVARRAVCRAKPGDCLKTGERFGIIKFSSRVDLFLPLEAKIVVKVGDVVKAGETVVANWTEKE
jgi:phosphatidylserine decarboxylase